MEGKKVGCIVAFLILSFLITIRIVQIAKMAKYHSSCTIKKKPKCCNHEIIEEGEDIEDAIKDAMKE